MAARTIRPKEEHKENPTIMLVPHHYGEERRTQCSRRVLRRQDTASHWREFSDSSPSKELTHLRDQLSALSWLASSVQLLAQEEVLGRVPVSARAGLQGVLRSKKGNLARAALPQGAGRPREGRGASGLSSSRLEPETPTRLQACPVWGSHRRAWGDPQRLNVPTGEGCSRQELMLVAWVCQHLNVARGGVGQPRDFFTYRHGEEQSHLRL